LVARFTGGVARLKDVRNAFNVRDDRGDKYAAEETIPYRSTLGTL
jgi:hypothetical protein